MNEQTRYEICPSTAQEMLANWSTLINLARGEKAKTEVRLDIDARWHAVLEAAQTMILTDEQLASLRVRWHNPDMTERACRNRIIERLIAVREELLL